MCAAQCHKFYVRFSCGLATCPNCSRAHAQRSFSRYLPRLLSAESWIAQDCANSGRTYRRLTIAFTRKTDGIPHGTEVRSFYDTVRSFWGLLRRKLGWSKSSFGVLMVLHVAPGCIRVGACYIGPAVEAKMYEIWSLVNSPLDALTFHPVESVAIAAASAFQAPILDPSEAARVEPTLDRIRRVRALGELYGTKGEKAEDNFRSGCPYDGSELLRIIGRFQPIERLERDGYRNLVVVRKEVKSAASPPGVAA
jgi:hypothetical protein